MRAARTESGKPPGSILQARYRIGERIGDGDYGDVFEAEDLLRLAIGETEPVAVKCLDPAFVRAAGGIPLVARQLATACRFSHPNVVNVFDFQETGQGSLVLVMERLAGDTLEDWLRKAGQEVPATTEEAVRILHEILDGLAHMHRSTPILRLHPGRVRLAAEGRALCITDLGLARLLDARLLHQAAVTSAIAYYTAPEILSSECGRRELPDHRADQFSLGAMATVLFTGMPNASMDMLARRLQGSPAAPWLEWIPRLMARNPEDRFPDIEQFRDRVAESGHASRPRRRSRRGRSAGRAGPGVGRSAGRRLAVGLGALGAASLGIAALLPPSVFRSQTASRQEPEAADRARHMLHQIDDLRLELGVRVLEHPELRDGVRNIIRGRSDFDAAVALGRISGEASNDSAGSGGGYHEIHAILDGRIREIEEALQAIEACERLAARRNIAQRMAALASVLPAGDVSALDSAWRRALEAFNSGHLASCLDTADSAVAAADSVFAEATEAARDRAMTSRALWLRALAGHGDFPPVDPIGAPSTHISAGEAAQVSGDFPQAVTEFHAARERYDDWTARLGGVPDRKATPLVVSENFLGMRFVPIANLEVSIWETRLVDFLAFAWDTGVDSSAQWRTFAAEHDQGPLHPVTFVNVSDALAFCRWLTIRERQSGRIDGSSEYRLPTDEEWSRFAGLEDNPELAPHERSFGFPDHYPWGDDPVRRAGNGNYDTFPNREKHHRFIQAQDEFPFTSPVGSFSPNAYGLYDLGGNVWEWTTDSLYGDRNEEYKVLRGAGWRSLSLETMRTAHRRSARSSNDEIGFRVVLARGSGTSATAGPSIRSAGETDASSADGE